MGRDTFIPYETIVKELILEEQQFIRDLNLITKVPDPYVSVDTAIPSKHLMYKLTNL